MLKKKAALKKQAKAKDRVDRLSASIAAKKKDRNKCARRPDVQRETLG